MFHSRTFLVKFETILQCPTFYKSRANFARRIIQPKVVRVNNKSDLNYSKPMISPDGTKQKFSPKHFDDGIFVETKKNQSQGNRLNLKINDDNSELPKFERNNPKNNVFGRTMVALFLKQNQKAETTILLEGKRLINDAIANNIKIHYIFFTSKEQLKVIENLSMLVDEQLSRTKLVKVQMKDMKIYSSLTTSPGLMAIAEKPNYNELMRLRTEEDADLPLTVICDNIRDPGNMGTILRTAAGAGAHKIILIEGCVNPWNNKVIKSAAGAHFRIPILSKVSWKDLQENLSEKFDLYIADSKPYLKQEIIETDTNNLLVKPTLYHQVDFFQNNDHDMNKFNKVLIIGNEAFGLSSSTYQFAAKHFGQRLRIPLYGNSESLNSAMAASILIYEIRRQFDMKFLNDNSKKIELCENP